jgi:hypothetical protein
VTAGGRRPPIRVLIADDQRVVRDGLAMLAGLDRRGRDRRRRVRR